MRFDFYVYKLCLNKKVVYYGKGTKERFWTTQRANKQSESFKDQMLRKHAVSATIIAGGLNEKFALLLERKLIETAIKKQVLLWNDEIMQISNRSRKLTEKEARAIRFLSLNSDLTQNQIAKAFGIKQQTVSDIKIGRSWSYLV